MLMMIPRHRPSVPILLSLPHHQSYHSTKASISQTVEASELSVSETHSLSGSSRLLQHNHHEPQRQRQGQGETNHHLHLNRFWSSACAYLPSRPQEATSALPNHSRSTTNTNTTTLTCGQVVKAPGHGQGQRQRRKWPSSPHRSL